MAQHIPYHPAPGIRGLAPGWVKLPVLTNPVTYVAPSSGGAGPAAGSNGTIGLDAAGNLVPTFGMGNVQPGLGAFIAARFPVPQNPILDAFRKSSMSGCGCAGCGKGLGQLDFSLTDILSGNAGTETYLVLGLGAVALYFLFAGGKRARSAYHSTSQQRAEKKARVASAQAAYYRSLES